MKTMSALELTRATQDSEDRRESRFTQPRSECPRPDFWTSEDVEATENEVIAGVGGLVRLLQPEYVIETGTHRGFMAESIGAALLENGHGELDTIEIDPELHKEAKRRVFKAPNVNAVLGDSLEFTPKGPIDFAWLDSGPGDVRAKEFIRFYPFMHSRTIVGFHDCGVHHRTIREACIQLARAGRLIPIFLPTPRGVALCQVLK
jgi:predicted O-methyltransferase YrrM